MYLIASMQIVVEEERNKILDEERIKDGISKKIDREIKIIQLCGKLVEHIGKTRLLCN